MKKRYWLKGGIKGAIINFVYAIITLFLFYPDFSNNNGLGDLGWSMVNIHNAPVGVYIDENFFYDWLYTPIIASLITGFIIGAIIGLIYEMIKNRKH